MTAEVRVRFAPSTTQFLDVPRARTALANWLFARKHGGTFILRVEDSLPGGSAQAQIHSIIDGMMYLGLKPDEGPFFQSTFAAEHGAEAERLLEQGHAYRCFCTPEALDGRRRLAEGGTRTWRYDRACLSLTDAERSRYRAEHRPFAVRFKVPSGSTSFQDFVHGVTRRDNADIEDFVLQRPDGSPTPDLADVADDLKMRISHVIRGDEHRSSTPRQILLFRALGAEPPIFAHLPVVRGRDGRRLTGETPGERLLPYRDQGILADAMVNLLALLGWSPPEEREILAREDLVAAWSFEGVGRTPAVFDPAALYRLNGLHIRHMPAERLLPLVRTTLIPAGLWREDLDGARRPWLVEVVDLLRRRARTIPDFAKFGRPFLTDEFEIDGDAAAKHLADPAVPGRLNRLADALGQAHPWNSRTIERSVRALAAELGLPAAKLIQPARVALTGRSASAGIYRVISAIGRERSVARLRGAASPDVPARAERIR